MNAFERATTAYDTDHERALVDAITKAIGEASMVSEPPVMVIRTGEITSALLTVLASAIALSPSSVRSPTAIRHVMDELKRRLFRHVAAARKNPDFQDFEARVFRDDDRERGGRA